MPSRMTRSAPRRHRISLPRRRGSASRPGPSRAAHVRARRPRRAPPCPPGVATTSRPSQSTACAVPSSVEPSGRLTATCGARPWTTSPGSPGPGPRRPGRRAPASSAGTAARPRAGRPAAPGRGRPSRRAPARATSRCRAARRRVVFTFRPMPTTTAVARALGEDPGQLAAVDGQQVVGPLERGADAGHLADRLGQGDPGQQRQPAAAGGRDVGAQQERDGEAGPRRRRPDPVQPAPAGDLVLGDEHRTLGASVGRRGERGRRWSTRSRRPPRGVRQSALSRVRAACERRSVEGRPVQIRPAR